MSTIRILLVDDQALVRRGLRQLLALEEGVEVVGEAADGREALDLIAGGVVPDVALVDARMPGMDGIELIGRLRTDHPEIATLLLTTFDEDELLFGSLAAGAGGFLLKDVEPEDLMQAIRSVRGRTMVVDDHMAERLVARLRAGAQVAVPEDEGTVVHSEASAAAYIPDGPPGSPALTERELEVARMVAAGASNREIAGALFLGEGTVKNHVSAALRKLGLRDRTQLALAMRRP
ncbi:response regulator transcription factor [Ammonicoccus fulvus]|uniref:Response regulator transcription factor n=1 Tax=Ammonicoccus fulvus TaxID=3138240 RepID=A0ABZ3FM37_9ACTN